MDLIAQKPQDLSALTREDLCTLVASLVDNQQRLAVSQQGMLEEIRLLRRSVQQLTKVSPAQATQLNRLMRETAEKLCAQYRLQDIENGAVRLCNCIRRDVRLRAGIQSMRELPRCEFEAYCNYIALWDDYKAVKTLRKKAGR